MTNTAKNNILISLCGTSPAVITETISALIDSRPAWVPDEVVVITTRSGAKCLQEEVFASGVFLALKKALKCEGISFADTSEHIRIIPAGDGETDAWDILSSSDSDRMADFTLGTLRQYTENPDTRIVFSLAGGRKTMSAVGALCMSLLGRDCDRLCHVLVNPPFDNPALEPKFHFPACPETIHRLPNGETINSKKAQITLCDIPFVRLRYLFEKKLLRLPGSFTGTVDLANDAINTENLPPVDIELKPDSLVCLVDNIPVALSAAEFAIYWLLALRRKAGQPPIRGHKDLLEEFTTFLASTPLSLMPDLYALNQRKFDEEDMRKLISSASAKLKKALAGVRGAILCLPARSKGLYGIADPPERIHCPLNR